MNLFFDGARSALLSVGVALFLLLLFSQKKKEELLLPLVSLLVAFLLYFIINQLLASAGHTLVRTTTSGRSALYLSSLSQFFEHPFFGVGGGNFKAWHNHPTSHPHSFVFKWLVEAGLVGLGFLLLFFWGAWRLFSQGRKVQGWAWAAPAMVTVNALFSGGFVYPLSQFLSFLLFSYGISLVLSSSEIRKSPTAPTTFTAPMIGGTPFLATAKSGGLSAFIVVKALSLVAILLMIVMTAKTLPVIKKMDLAEDFSLEARAQYREYFQLSHGPSLWQRGPIIEFDGTLKEYRRPQK